MSSIVISKRPEQTPFSIAQLRRLKDSATELRQEAVEWRASLRDLGVDERARRYGVGINWAWAYELTVLQHQAVLFWAAGLSDQLAATLDAAADKTVAFFEFVERYQPSPDALRIFDETSNQWRRPLVTSLLLGLILQYECLAQEGCYVSDLVQKVRDGDDEAFFRVLRIDRTAVACDALSERICRAEIEDDKEFFSALGRLLGSRWAKKSPNARESHKSLRVVLQATLETGQLGRLTMTEADELFIGELAVYSSDGEDPVRGLLRFISRFKNNK